MFRDWSRDDPVRDAEDAQRDDRPIIGTCDECGGEIHGSAPGWHGDEIFESNEIKVHVDCLMAWTKQFIKEVE